MELLIPCLVLSFLSFGKVCDCINISSFDVQSIMPSSVLAEKLSHKIPGDSDGGLDNRKYSAVLSTSERRKAPNTPRGFAGYEVNYEDAQNTRVDNVKKGWSPYLLPGQQKDTSPDGTSNVNWRVHKKTDSRQATIQNDFRYPGYPPDYADMLMMMQFMKKVDPVNPRPGLMSRILDNPVALTMLTFIPISLLVVAALPLLTNLMMNGVTIPPVLQTTGSKTRKLPDASFTEITVPILRNLADFGSRYIENPDCLNRIFCEIASDNGTRSENINYIKRAFDTTTNIASEGLLKIFGVQNFVEIIRDGKCEKLSCPSRDKSKERLSNLMDDIMFKHSQNIKPKS